MMAINNIVKPEGDEDRFWRGNAAGLDKIHSFIGKKNFDSTIDVCTN
jgi:hypothetical protein